jgi:hypothetical protein
MATDDSTRGKSTSKQYLKLTTGDLWDADAHQPVDNGCHPERETDDRRRSAEYIGRFRERIPLARAIRMKCGACMGGDNERMPQGEVARAIDECGSCMCPLWPFRYGRDPWRPEATEAVREVGRRTIQAARAARNDPGTQPTERRQSTSGQEDAGEASGGASGRAIAIRVAEPSHGAWP